MRSIGGALQARLNLGAGTLAHLFRITRKDGTVIRLTDHDQPITYSSNVYSPNASLVMSGITTSANNGIQSTDCQVIFSDTVISKIDVLRGVYDNATVEFSVVDWTYPTYGEILLLSGIVSVFSVTDRGIGTFEIRGKLARGDARIGEYYSAECRADLGDARCGVALAGFQDTGVVEVITRQSNLVVNFAGNPADGFYSLGVLTMTSGNNNGFSMEVLNQVAYDASWDRLFLGLPFPYDVVVGDTFTITAGCDHRINTCKTKFNNILNFRGEPFVPGQDAITDYRSE
jgi:uncharacterized phage protein (TIGR02218 family)